MRGHEVKEFVAGVLTLIGLGLIILLLNTREHLLAGTVPGNYTIYAIFNRVDGLNVGAPVMFSGVPVGAVQQVALDDNFRVRMTLTIDSGVEIPLDTSAAVHTDGLFGGKFVSLDPGGDLEVLGDGDTITFTQDAVVVSELLDLIIAEGKARREAAPPEDTPEQ